MSRHSSQRGSLTLETAIVLPIFLFLVLFIYSLFGIFSVHNQMSHALIQAGKSLSLDPYLYSQTNLAGATTTTFWGSLGDIGLNIFRNNNDPYFMTRFDWHNLPEAQEEVVRLRFIGYLSGGDPDAADKKLTDLRVVDGLDGVKFETNITGTDTLQITMSYTMKALFDFWDFGEHPVKQSITVKLWAPIEIEEEPKNPSQGGGGLGALGGGLASMGGDSEGAPGSGGSMGGRG